VIKPFNPTDDQEYADCRVEEELRDMIGDPNYILRVSKFGWSNIYALLRQLDRVREHLDDKNAEIMYLKDKLGSVEQSTKN
jgi:hypothetical protein